MLKYVKESIARILTITDTAFMPPPVDRLKTDLSACTLCSDRFRDTKTNHTPRPVVWFNQSARILIAGQAPGARVHASGIPFDDRSGDRLRDWMGVSKSEFYDQTQIAIVPMAFCFPGYDAKGSDLPPPPICAETWRSDVIDALPEIRLTLLIGAYAQSWHLGHPSSTKMTDTVRDWRSHLPGAIPLPHPSWRNTGWVRKHPWFEGDLLPVLKKRVKAALE